MYRIKLQSNPNNELRVTLYPVRHKRAETGDIDDSKFASPSPELLPCGEQSSSDSSPPPSLDIRSDFKTVCSAMSYDRTEFGRYAKTRIMRSAGAMDRNDPYPWHYTFLTATLPSNEELAKWAIAQEAPWIVNTLKAWLSKRAQCRFEFYVWEHQKRGALHFHWCLYTPSESLRNCLAEEFRLEWFRILDGVEKRTSVNMWGRFQYLSATARYCIVQTKVETIRKSVAAYMAGYCGVGKDKHEKDHYIPYYPKRWYGVSRNLSTLVQKYYKEETIEFPNYRTAKLSFDEFNREFEQEEIKGKIWRHNVGAGETGVHYHPPKIQEQLWQSRKTMQYKRHTHPNTSSILMELEKISTTHVNSMQSSQLYRAICSKLPLESLQDGLYRDSLRRGILRDCQLKAVEILYIALSSRLNLPPTLSQLLTGLRLFSLTVSLNYPHLKFNKYGYLAIHDDLPYSVDDARNSCESRTSCDGEGEGVSLDGSCGPVPGELTDTHQTVQLPLLS